MRFLTFMILVGVGAIMLTGRHRVSFHFAQAQPAPDRIPYIPYERDPAWGSRYTEDDCKFQPDEDWGTGRDWPRLPMAIVMLVGGTLVCRRIFRSGPVRSRPIQLKYRSQPAAPVPPARPRPVVAADRICPRADCARSNPQIARFCRRCGAALNDV